MLPSIMKWTRIFLFDFSDFFFTFKSLKWILYVFDRSNSNIVTKPLLSRGTNNVLFTCKPATSCLVESNPFSCLEDTTKLGSRLRTPSSIEISTVIRPKARAGGTYNPPLSYLAPIHVQLAESDPLDEQTIY